MFSSKLSSAEPECTHCGLSNALSLENPTLHLPEPGSNYSAPDEQTGPLNTLIAQGQSRIFHLTLAIERMKSQRRTLQATVNNRQSFLAPFNYISDEVLLLIFSQRGSSFPADDIWAISAVCRRWRTVALSCSHLWTRLLYCEGKWHDTKKAHRDVRRMEIQIARTQGDQLLDLHVHGEAHFHCSYWGNRCPPTNAAWKFIANNAHRFEAIELDGEFGVGDKGLAILPLPLDVRNLRRLTVHNSKSYASWLRYTSDFFAFTPRLQAFTLTSVEYCSRTLYGPAASAFNWATLTFLHLSGIWMHADEYLDIISSAIELEHLVIEKSQRSCRDPPDPHRIVTHRKLRILRVSLELCPDVTEWGENTDEERLIECHFHMALERLRTPQLETLELRNMTQLYIPHVQRFLQGCTSTLSEVSFIALDMQDTALLVPILRAIPSVRRLELGGPLEDQQISVIPLCQALILSGTSVDLCPALEELNISFLALDQATLKEVVESRLQDPDHLQSSESTVKLKKIVLNSVVWVLPLDEGQDEHTERCTSDRRDAAVDFGHEEAT